MSTPTTYWKNWRKGIQTALGGLALTGAHFGRKRRRPQGIAEADYFHQPDGPVTIQYPREEIPVPDTGRYRLFTEIDDCIGCDKCSRVCPVDCITIEKIRAPAGRGLTSDGSKKSFYFPTFDIDMAKCMYCGLCTVVCPTECIIMTKAYDFSTTDREDFLYQFGDTSPEETPVRLAELAAFEEKKKAAKAEALAKAKASNPQADA